MRLRRQHQSFVGRTGVGAAINSGRIADFRIGVNRHSAQKRTASNDNDRRELATFL